jgi:hypothetical protein
VTARLPVEVIARLRAADPEDIPGQVQASTTSPAAGNWAEGHNHISEIASLGINDALGTQLGRFIDRMVTV